MSSDPRPTYAARLTASTASAIASIAVAGPAAKELVTRYASTPGGRSLSLVMGKPRFALWRMNAVNMNSEHVVLIALPGDRLEIHCHGGIAITNMILEQLWESGCRAGDARQLCFEADQAAEDDWQLDARIELERAATLKVAAILLDQWQGALSRAMRQLNELCLAGDKTGAQLLRQQLVQRAAFGLRLTDPWRFTLAGPPNVGKSSLTNALLGSRRVLVHDQPGTTRDAVDATLVIAGWPMVLTDTAGVREGASTIERLGIEAAQSRWKIAEIGLLVIDAQVGWTPTHSKLAEDRDGPMVVVVNKADQWSEQQRSIGLQNVMQRASEALAGKLVGVCATSAKSSEGVQPLIEQLGSCIDRLAPPSGAAVPFLPKHLAALQSP